MDTSMFARAMENTNTSANFPAALLDSETSHCLLDHDYIRSNSGLSEGDALVVGQVIVMKSAKRSVDLQAAATSSMETEDSAANMPAKKARIFGEKCADLLFANVLTNCLSGAPPTLAGLEDEENHCRSRLFMVKKEISERELVQAGNRTEKQKIQSQLGFQSAELQRHQTALREALSRSQEAELALPKLEDSIKQLEQRLDQMAMDQWKTELELRQLQVAELKHRLFGNPLMTDAKKLQEAIARIGREHSTNLEEVNQALGVLTRSKEELHKYQVIHQQSLRIVGKLEEELECTKREMKLLETKLEHVNARNQTLHLKLVFLKEEERQLQLAIVKTGFMKYVLVGRDQLMQTVLSIDNSS